MDISKRIGVSLVVLGFIFVLCADTLQAAKLGKLFIRVATPEESGQQFVNAGLADSVKDLKARLGDFALADDEASADFLMVVVRREGTERERRLYANFSVRDGAKWRPAAELTNGGSFVGGNGAWGNAARGVIGAAEKWVKENRPK